jgi:hypothetical protein
VFAAISLCKLKRTKKTNDGYKEKQTLERSKMEMPVHREEKSNHDPLEM